jgi:hypothetical protein
MEQCLMPKRKEISFQFKFNNINTLRFIIDNRPDAIRDADAEGYKIQISGANFINITNNILGFDIIIDITTNDKSNIKVCELIQRVSFSVKNLDKIAIIKENEVSLPDQILLHLFSLSFSSARGILHEKLRGSIIEGLILPPINVKDIIANMRTPNKSEGL